MRVRGVFSPVEGGAGYTFNIPFSGGTYFRILPEWMIEQFANYINVNLK